MSGSSTKHTLRFPYSVNNKHHAIEQSTSVVRCLKCFETMIVLPNIENSLTASSDNICNARCKCSNVGVILDNQGTLRVYVQDIRTIHLGVAILNHNNEVINTEWGDYSETLNYIPYKDVKSNGILFNDVSAKGLKAFKKSTNKVTNKMSSLVQALDLGADTKGRDFFYKPKD